MASRMTLKIWNMKDHGQDVYLWVRDADMKMNNTEINHKS